VPCCAESFGRGVLGITARDRTFSVAKLFFAYGLGNALYFPFSVGGSTILLPDKPDSRRIFDIVRRYRPTLFYAVPTAYSAMLAEMDAGTPCDFSSVRLCSSAGEPLAPSLYERWLSHTRIEILDGIGSTEMLHTFIANREGRVRPGSSGELVPGYDARIVDADGRDVVPDGTTMGEIALRGNDVMLSYYRDEDATRAASPDGWFRTGDLAVVHPDGYVEIRDRAKDVIISGGENIASIEVEQVLVSHPAVREAAVVASPDARWGEVPTAFVTLVDGAVATPDELIGFVKSRLAGFKAPKRVVFGDLPKTSTGKIMKHVLREQARSVLGPPGFCGDWFGWFPLFN
jgi:benzoate-CoA ligase